jgi:hypothetical protein
MYRHSYQLSVIISYSYTRAYQPHRPYSPSHAPHLGSEIHLYLYAICTCICIMYMHSTYTCTQIAACRIYYLYTYTHRSIIDILSPPAVFLLYWVLARVKHGHSSVSGAVYQHQLTGTDACIYCIYCICCISDDTKNKSTQSASLLIFQWPCVTHKVLPPGLTPFL